ncbi:MAG: stage IV sporulation protein A [Bacilli bacterium]|nr:stage IV sporulation protein A [Bacilli bacterium]
MEKIDIIKSITERTGGDIYLGVVGAVRTGKSTFIKRFIENLVVPNITDEYERKRTLDEIPQSAQGKTIMTTEPKFVPSNATKINIDDFSANVRLIDCVGYIIEGSKGYEDENGPRMVHTPWYEESIPFVEAAEIGTEKVIKDHSSIGVLVTTDGSIGEFKRADYIDAEKRIAEELSEIGKPHIVILNSTHPMLPETEDLALSLKKQYNVPVIPMNVDNMSERDAYNILKEALYEFPVTCIDVEMADWVACLDANNWLKKSYIDSIRESIHEIDKLRDIETITNKLETNEYIEKAYLSDVNTATGNVKVKLKTPANLYNQVLKEIIGVDITNRSQLLSLFQDLSEAKREYDQVKDALKMVKQTGYGVASPTLSDMTLDTPEIIKQGSRYGIKLKAVAPSIHMIRVDVESTFEPIIGSEIQSKELINYLMKDKEQGTENIWKSEIFGRSLDVIVKEGIQAKLSLMPEAVRYKLKQTLSKLVNKGSSNLFAIVI